MRSASSFSRRFASSSARFAFSASRRDFFGVNRGLQLAFELHGPGMCGIAPERRARRLERRLEVPRRARLSRHGELLVDLAAQPLGTLAGFGLLPERAETLGERIERRQLFERLDRRGEARRLDEAPDVAQTRRHLFLDGERFLRLFERTPFVGTGRIERERRWGGGPGRLEVAAAQARGRLCKLGGHLRAQLLRGACASASWRRASSARRAPPPAAGARPA